MSNVELARLLCAAMLDLAQMVIWCQRGNSERARRCENRFRERVAVLDGMETDGDVDD